MIVPVGYCNLQLLFTLANGRDGLTACGFVAESLSADDLIQVNGNWATSSDYAQNRCTADTVYKGSRLVIGTSTPGAPIVFELSSNQPGGNSDTGISPNVALLVTKRTNLGGRKGRGRCYLPGLSENAVDAAGVLTGDVSGMRTDAEAFWEQMTFGTSMEDAVLLHDDPGTPPSPIVSFDMATQVATQRRRLRG